MGARPAAVAGRFYPSDPDELRQAVTTYMEDSGVDPAPAGVAAIIVPHAGYLYSGPTAGHAFARVRGMKPKRVVLMGRSHHYKFEGVSLCDSAAFTTPLGNLPIDTDFIADIWRREKCAGAHPHAPEHALEVEVPFIQVAFGEVPLVPLLFGVDPDPCHIQFGQRLAEYVEPGDLVVVSTDLSHYLSEKEANAIDASSLKQVQKKDCASFLQAVSAGACSMCGATAVLAGMSEALSAGATDWRLLDYRTSAAVTGDYQHVVGYGALSLEMAA